MNERKQKQLFATARACAPAEAPSNFSSLVMGAIRRGGCRPATAPLLEQLSALFPRLATAALIIIGVALAFEFFAGDDIASELAQVSDQWLLPMNWL